MSTPDLTTLSARLDAHATRLRAVEERLGLAETSDLSAALDGAHREIADLRRKLANAAAKQAEAVRVGIVGGTIPFDEVKYDSDSLAVALATIRAVRARLAALSGPVTAPPQEPVAWAVADCDRNPNERGPIAAGPIGGYPVSARCERCDREDCKLREAERAYAAEAEAHRDNPNWHHTVGALPFGLAVDRAIESCQRNAKNWRAESKVHEHRADEAERLLSAAQEHLRAIARAVGAQDTGGGQSMEGTDLRTYRDAVRRVEEMVAWRARVEPLIEAVREKKDAARSTHASPDTHRRPDGGAALVAAALLAIDDALDALLAAAKESTNA